MKAEPRQCIAPPATRMSLRVCPRRNYLRAAAGASAPGSDVAGGQTLDLFTVMATACAQVSKLRWRPLHIDQSEKPLTMVGGACVWQLCRRRRISGSILV